MGAAWLAVFPARFAVLLSKIFLLVFIFIESATALKVVMDHALEPPRI